MRQNDGNDTRRNPVPETEFEASGLDPSLDASLDAESERNLAAPAEDRADDAVAARSSDLQATSRPSPRRTAITTVSSAAAVVLTLLVLLTVPVGCAPLVVNPFPTPTPNTQLAAGDDLITLQNTVPWGTLQLDGHQIPLPVAGLEGGRPYPTIVLDRGTHTLDFTAPLFPPKHCIVSSPAQARDTCLVAAHVTVNGVPLRVIDLQATPNNLPPDQYAALAAVVQATLTSGPMELAPGDHYPRSDGSFGAATGKWQVTLLTSLNQKGSGASGFTFDGQPCQSLCTAGSLAGQPGTPFDEWLVVANVQAAWQVTDETGRVVDTAPVVTNQPGHPESPILAGLAVEWNGAWSATLISALTASESLCKNGEEQLSLLLNSPGVTAASMSITSTQSVSPDAACLLQVKRQPSVAPGTPSVPTPVGIVLYRFGALVAADEGAHTLLPQLPLPSASEQAIIAVLVPVLPGG